MCHPGVLVGRLKRRGSCSEPWNLDNSLSFLVWRGFEGGGWVTDRLLVELAADGRVSVVPWLEGELPGGAAGEPFQLVWPLDGDGLEELRWYLEDYLRAPFGVYESRGPETATRLKPWGEAIFAAVFGAGAARDVYKQARARPAGLQLVFRSGAVICPELSGQRICG